MKRLIFLFFILLSSCSKDSGNYSLPDFLSQQKQAATDTANSNPHCQALTDFYWEVGNKNGLLVSGTTGNHTITGSTNLPVASAGKFVWGIYTVQKKNGVLTPTDIKYLTMSSGYTNFGNFTCVPNSIDTVQKCFEAANNSEYTAANDNKFYYNGGHFQKMAMDMGLGSLTEPALTSEVSSTLGGGFNIEYTSPHLAGGITTSGIEYGKILRKVVNQELIMYQMLGTHAVCTDCTDSVYTPVEGGLEYSLGHWVEKDDDGAFSSAGLFGFYPWIDQSKTYYGLISRYEGPTGDNQIGTGYASLLCGREIRKAFISGERR